MWKSIGLIVVFAVTLLSAWSVVQALDYISQNVSFSIGAINEIAVTRDLKIAGIKTIVVKSQPMKVIHATSKYLVTTNGLNKKITGVLGTALPEDSNLTISLEAPTGATSVGSVELKNNPIDLVTGVTKVAESERIITYRFSAPVATQLEKPLAEVVILTITN